MRVRLRPVEDGDLAVLFEHQRDAEAARMAAFVPRDPDDRAAFDAHWARVRADGKITLRTVLVENEVAGNCAAFPMDGRLEVTYWIGREYWGRGVATAALRALLREVTARPIHAGVARDNLGSRRVLEKCGFVVTGESRGFSKVRGEEIDELLLTLDSDREDPP